MWTIKYLISDQEITKVTNSKETKLFKDKKQTKTCDISHGIHEIIIELANLDCLIMKILYATG